MSVFRDNPTPEFGPPFSDATATEIDLWDKVVTSLCVDPNMPNVSKVTHWADCFVKARRKRFGRV